MRWNIDGIAFLHPPDVFTGSFDNAKMQARHEQQMQAKLEEIKTGLDREADPLQAMKKLHAKDHHLFFQNNVESFREAGRFEEAVLVLYGRLNSPFSAGGDTNLWNTLFSACERTRLYSLGHPVTTASATVFRGSVTGLVRSLSWTPDRERAKRFAERWKDPSLGGGEVYQLDITKADILVYLKHRHEEEILVNPEFIRTAEIRVLDAGLRIVPCPSRS